MRQNALWIVLIILLTSVFAVGTVASSPSSTRVRAPTIADATLVPFTVTISIVTIGIAVYFLKTRKANASRTQPRILCSRFFLSSAGNKTCEGSAKNEKSSKVR